MCVVVASCTYSYCGEQYWLNMVIMVSSVTLALFKSVAVHSMKTFLVFNVILLWSPENKFYAGDTWCQMFLKKL